MRALALFLPLLAASCATPDAGAQDRAAARIAKALEGRTPGDTRRCLPGFRADGPEIIDQNTILYREGRRVWRNDLPSACPFMRPGQTLIVEMFGSDICENDLFSVIEPTSRIPSGKCRMGRFTPYDKPKR